MKWQQDAVMTQRAAGGGTAEGWLPAHATAVPMWPCVGLDCSSLAPARIPVVVDLISVLQRWRYCMWTGNLRWEVQAKTRSETHRPRLQQCPEVSERVTKESPSTLFHPCTGGLNSLRFQPTACVAEETGARDAGPVFAAVVLFMVIYLAPGELRLDGEEVPAAKKCLAIVVFVSTLWATEVCIATRIADAHGTPRTASCSLGRDQRTLIARGHLTAQAIPLYVTSLLIPLLSVSCGALLPPPPSTPCPAGDAACLSAQFVPYKPPQAAKEVCAQVFPKAPSPTK